MMNEIAQEEREAIFDAGWSQGYGYAKGLNNDRADYSVLEKINGDGMPVKLAKILKRYIQREAGMLGRTGKHCHDEDMVDWFIASRGGNSEMPKM